MEDLKKEERVKLPEGWNSDDATWIKKEDFKDKNGEEIGDIDKKIKKFVELLNRIKPLEFKGGITNFCFRFPDIVKNIFGTECKLQKGNLVTRFWIKDKSTNPFDHKDFCDAIFNFIDKNSGSEDAKKQNYCLLLEMIFMKPGFIGSYGNFGYDGTLISIENHVLYIFTQKTWTHMPIISSMFMEKLCSKITNTDIEKYNFKFVLKAENNDQEISKYGSIVINGADIHNIEALNKLKLSYYKALLKNKFNPNESKDFFNTISLYLVDFVCDSNNSRDKINLIREINQYTNVNNFLNEKQNLQQLESIPNKIMRGALWDQSKLSLLRELFAIIADLLQRTDDKKQYWKLASNAIDCIESIIKTPNNYNKIQWHIDGCLKQIYDVAVFIDPDQAYQKISDLFISVAPSCYVNIFTSFLNLLRGDTEKEPNKYYLDAISSVSEELATNKEIKQAKDKLCEFVEFIRTDPKKNISSDIFQSLFNAINKHFPMSKDNNGCTARCRLLKKLFCDFATANPKAEEVYFEKVETIMDEYQKFLNDNKSQIPFNSYKRQNFAEPQINSLIKIVVIGRKKLSNGKVKYKDVMQIVDIIDKSFPSDGEKDKKDRCEAITHLFQLLTKHGLLEAFLFPFDLSFFVEQGVTVVFKTSVTWFKNGWKKFRNQRPKKQMTDFISPKDADKATKSKGKNDTTKSNEKKIEILSYREILPDEINNTVDNYNKELKKEQVNEKFDLDAQVFRDIEKDVIQERLFELNKIINNNASEQKNPLIGIFRFLSTQQFKLDQFLSIFQCSYLDTVVDLINLPILDYVINKYDVTQEAGELFESKDKNAEENDKFNQKLAYNPRLKSINKLLINHFIRQGIKSIVKNLDEFLSSIDVTESLQKKIDEVSQKITSSLLKKFSSVYGIILKIQTAAKNVGEKGEYNTTASAIFDFVLDFINGGNDDSNLLTLLLELVSEFDFEDLNIGKDPVQLEEDTYDVINFFMGLITFSKALDCDTEIFADGGSENNKKKTTDKLINLLKKIVDTKEFKCFVGKCLSKEYVNKIKQLIDDVAKLKFEDCAYLLCSDEILAQNKENGKNDKDKGDKDKNENTINSINIGSEEDEKNDLFNIDNKNSIKKENKKESKLDIILNQTAMFSWLRKNKHGNTTFFDLRTSLSDEKKIKEFEKYKKEQIKNNQEKTEKIENIKVNNDINLQDDSKLNDNKQTGDNTIKKDQIEKSLNGNEMKSDLNNNINKINKEEKREEENKSDIKDINGNNNIIEKEKEDKEGKKKENNNIINLEDDKDRKENNITEKKADITLSLIKNQFNKSEDREQEKVDLNVDPNVNEIKDDSELNNNKQMENNTIKKKQLERNLNDNEMKSDLNNNKDNINKINIDTCSQKNESDNNLNKKTDEKNNNTIQLANKSKIENSNMQIENDQVNKNNEMKKNDLFKKETNKKSDNTNQFDAIKNLFSKSEEVKDENKNIDNDNKEIKEIRERRNSLMLERKFTLDDMNNDNIENQIVAQIKAGENDNKENNNVIENDQGVVNNAKSKYKENNTQDINIDNNRKNNKMIENIILDINDENNKSDNKSENESENEEEGNKIKNVNESANINSKLDGKTINFEAKSQDEIKNKNDNDIVRLDINSPEKNKEKTDIQNMLQHIVIVKKKKKPKKLNLGHIDKDGNSSQVAKEEEKNGIKNINENNNDFKTETKLRENNKNIINSEDNQEENKAQEEGGNNKNINIIEKKDKNGKQEKDDDNKFDFIKKQLEENENEDGNIKKEKIKERKSSFTMKINMKEMDINSIEEKIIDENKKYNKQDNKQDNSIIKNEMALENTTEINKSEETKGKEKKKDKDIDIEKKENTESKREGNNYTIITTEDKTENDNTGNDVKKDNKDNVNNLISYKNINLNGGNKEQLKSVNENNTDIIEEDKKEEKKNSKDNFEKTMQLEKNIDKNNKDDKKDEEVNNSINNNIKIENKSEEAEYTNLAFIKNQFKKDNNINAQQITQRRYSFTNNNKSSPSEQKKKEIDNPRIQQNEMIPTTKPSNKKKIIFAIIFGIIFVLSAVFLALALAIEALNFLALVVSMAVVATIALVIVIVFAFIIYRDNKKSEPEGLAPTFSFDRNNDDKKITRCNSLDCLKMIEANKQFDPKQF